MPKKLLSNASISEGYTSGRGYNTTLGNIAKATFHTISKTYSYLTPNFWSETVFNKPRYQKFTVQM